MIHYIATVVVLSVPVSWTCVRLAIPLLRRSQEGATAPLTIASAAAFLMCVIAAVWAAVGRAAVPAASLAMFWAIASAVLMMALKATEATEAIDATGGAGRSGMGSQGAGKMTAAAEAAVPEAAAAPEAAASEVAATAAAVPATALEPAGKSGSRGAAGLPSGSRRRAVTRAVRAGGRAAATAVRAAGVGVAGAIMGLMRSVATATRRTAKLARVAGKVARSAARVMRSVVRGGRSTAGATRTRVRAHTRARPRAGADAHAGAGGGGGAQAEAEAGIEQVPGVRADAARSDSMPAGAGGDAAVAPDDSSPGQGQPPPVYHVEGGDIEGQLRWVMAQLCTSEVVRDPNRKRQLIELQRRLHSMQAAQAAAAACSEVDPVSVERFYDQRTSRLNALLGRELTDDSRT